MVVTGESHSGHIIIYAIVITVAFFLLAITGLWCRRQYKKQALRNSNAQADQNLKDLMDI